MERSNKDLARARFKQQRCARRGPLPCPPPSPPLPKQTEPRRVPPSRRRSAFRDGRGRGRGRGRAPGRGSPFDNHDVDDDDDDDDPVPARRERRYDVFFPPSDDDADARSASASRSAGADLEALFAECDQAALPRQHPHTYMDPSWAVDDLPELERVLGATASDAGDMSLDPVALAEKLAALPLAELLGLSREYVEYMHGDEARDERTADTSEPTPSDEDSNPRPVDAETKDHGRRARPRANNPPPTRAPNPKPPTTTSIVSSRTTRYGEEDETPSEPRRRSRQVRMRTSKGTRKTTSWMSCWGRRGWADSRRGRRRGRRGRMTTRS